MIKIGLIGGFGGQAKRIIDSGLLRTYSIMFYEHDSTKTRPQIEGLSYTITPKLGDLLECNAIIICSITSSHYYYLRFLLDNNYEGYVFCEKPPVQTLEELKELANMPERVKQRILFDFNLRNSCLQEIVNSSEREEYGKILFMSIVSGHGLAFKPSYESSWRNDPVKMKHGVFETVGIHYVDFLLRNNGTLSNTVFSETTSSPYSRVPDSANLSMRFKNGFYANIFLSYATPLVEEICMICENAIIRLTDGNLFVYGPRDTFDKKGFFANPPLNNQRLYKEGFWNDSVYKTFALFLNAVNNKILFKPVDYDDALEANRFMLNLLDGKE